MLADAAVVRTLCSWFAAPGPGSENNSTFLSLLPHNQDVAWNFVLSRQQHVAVRQADSSPALAGGSLNEAGEHYVVCQGSCACPPARNNVASHDEHGAVSTPAAPFNSVSRHGPGFEASQ